MKLSKNNVILSVNNFKFHFTWTDIFTFISKVYCGNSPYTYPYTSRLQFSGNWINTQRNETGNESSKKYILKYQQSVERNLFQGATEVEDD